MRDRGDPVFIIASKEQVNNSGGAITRSFREFEISCAS